MKRRNFIAGLSSAVGVWPLAMRGQQTERRYRIGVLMAAAADDSEIQDRIGAFLQGLKQLGWIDGRNVQIEYRWGAGDDGRVRGHAQELVTLGPDVILAAGGQALALLLQVTRTLPIVFTGVADPVGAGYVNSLSRPGGNTTGFMLFEYSLSGKWPELLKQIAPSIRQAAVLRDPGTAGGIGQFAVIQSVAPSFGVDVSPISVRDAGEIERAITTFARSPDGGLIVTTSTFSTAHRSLIIKLAAQHNLPAIYYRRAFVTAGGLISYGYDMPERFRSAASYVDRILKGEKPADLPVQAPTKYDLVVNLKTAKALGLTIPQTLLSRADDVIE